MAKRPVTVNDMLDGQVALDLECPDRVYLNGYVPNLQVRHVPVEVHPIWALQIQRHLTIEHVVDRHRTLGHRAPPTSMEMPYSTPQPAAPPLRTATTHLDGPRRSLFRHPVPAPAHRRRKRKRPDRSRQSECGGAPARSGPYRPGAGLGRLRPDRHLQPRRP